RLTPTSSTLLPYTTLFRSPDEPAAKPPATDTTASTQSTAMTCPDFIKRLLSESDAVVTHADPCLPSERLVITQRFVLAIRRVQRSEEHTSELQSRFDLVCR